MSKKARQAIAACRPCVLPPPPSPASAACPPPPSRMLPPPCLLPPSRQSGTPCASHMRSAHGRVEQRVGASTRPSKQGAMQALGDAGTIPGLPGAFTSLAPSPQQMQPHLLVGVVRILHLVNPVARVRRWGWTAGQVGGALASSRLLGTRLWLRLRVLCCPLLGEVRGACHVRQRCTPAAGRLIAKQSPKQHLTRPHAAATRMSRVYK